MLGYLLNAVYLCVLLIASPWLVWSAIRHGKYRDGLKAKFLGLVPPREGSRPCIWFHAVSVGEVKLLEPLLERIAKENPDFDCVVSTTSKTGYTFAQMIYPDCHVFYAPLDFTWAVRRAMARIRPDVLALVELELWPNLIDVARRQGARVTMVNGRLSERSFQGYRRLGPLLRRVLWQIDTIAAQNAEYAKRFLALGAHEDSVTVTGSMKFDGAQTDRGNPRTQALRKLAGIGDGDVVFLAGSTQAPEEEMALETFRALADDHPRLRLIVVPRHPQRFAEVAEMLRASGFAWQRRSDLSQPNPRSRILLVDTVGELAFWWGAADIAYVGGSMGSRGGQNMIEPAAYGAAVSFGPKTESFRDVVAALLAARAAVVVRDRAELAAFVRLCLEHPRQAKELGTRAAGLVLENRGATQRTLAHIRELMPQSDGQQQDTRQAA